MESFGSIWRKNSIDTIMKQGQEKIDIVEPQIPEKEHNKSQRDPYGCEVPPSIE